MFFCCNVPPQKSNCVLLKINHHAQISKIPTLQKSYSNAVHDFQQVVFHTQNTIFVFCNIQKFIIIQKFNSHHCRGL